MSKPESSSSKSHQSDLRVLLVCDEPQDFQQLSLECQAVEFSFCKPSALKEHVFEVSQQSESASSLALAVDGRKLDWVAARQLVEPVLADPVLRLLPLVWLLKPHQQLEFELPQAELSLLTQYFYPDSQPGALFEARLRYLDLFKTPIENYSRFERQLQSAGRQIESSQDAIISIDLNELVLSWNPAAENIYGWSAEEAIGQSFPKLVHYQSPLTLDEQQLMAENPPYDIAWNNGKWSGIVIQQTRDGRKLIIDSSVAAVRDNSGKIIELVGINRDVTSQKQTERALIRSSGELEKANNFLERIIEQSPIGIGIFDKNGLMIQLNPAYCRILGIGESNTMVGRYNALRDPFSKISGIAEAIERVLNGEVVSMPPQELDFSELDQTFGTHNRKIILSRKLFPLFDSAGQVQNVVALVEDVTEQRHLTNQLLQSQKMEMIGALAGGLAHDYNNLLTVLFLSVDALKQRLLASGQTESLIELAEIESISRHAADLTSRLLIFTRQKQDQPELVSLNDVLKMTASLLRRTVSEDFQLTFKPSEDELPLVKASVAQLQQVLMNLVINARDAIQEKQLSASQHPSGGAAGVSRITIKTFSRYFEAIPKPGFQEETDGQRYVVLPEPNQIITGKQTVDFSQHEYVGITVEDNGTGIVADQMTRIFEPLYTTKESGKGTGLGLVICYAVARDCNGWLEVESQPGAGACFTFYLPKAEALQPGAIPPARLTPFERGAISRLPEVRSGSGRTPTVLLAEDEVVLRKVISRVLRLEGWKVLPVEDGVAALELYQEKQAEIDLVVTDTVMPRLGGLPLVNKLLEINPKIKVILMSGYFENTAELASISHLMSNYQVRFLSKPFKVEVLSEMLRGIAL